MSTTWSWRAIAPFLAVACLAQVSLGWPVMPVERPWAAAASVVLMLVLLGTAALAWWRRLRRLQTAVPLAFLLVVALWRHADGGATSGLTAMVGLSVLWLALHGSLRSVWISVAGVAVIMGVPLVVVHSGDYPLYDWPRAVLWTAFAALLGPMTHAVVTQRAVAASRVRDLEPSDSRFRGLLGAATEHAVIATDLAGMVTVFNRGAERMLGWQESDVVGRLALLEVFADDELGRRARELGTDTDLTVLVHAARCGRSETRDWTWLTRDGARRAVSLSISGVRDGDGLLSGYIAIASDVTEARVAERALAVQQETVQLMLDHLPDTVVGVLDADLRWVQIGGQWIKQRGVDTASFIGRRLGDRLSIGDPGVMHAFMRAAFERPGRGEFETEAGVWFEIDAVPLNAREGRPLLLAVCRDVTERKTVERERAEMVNALTASEEGFRTAFESAPVGIALTSADQGPQARFLRVNDALADLLGRPREEIEALTLDAVTHRDDRADRPPVLAGPAAPHRLRYVHASGRSVWVSEHSALVNDPRGRAAYVITHVADVTSRQESEKALYRALEQQRAAAEALEQADALRTETMSTISHELRTPLTSIEGYLELLADGVAGPMGEEQSRMLDVVRRNSSRLRELVDDLLVLSRLDEAEQSLASTTVDLGEVCRVALDTVRPLATARVQQLELRVDGGPHTVVGDADQLDRVLMNLLANAIKYTPEGGHVGVLLTCAADTVTLGVSDTGIGIPEAEQGRLFERFFRSSTAQRRGIEGTGLGLAIARSIVERHRGRIGVTSDPGRGSCFRVELPVAARSPSPAQASR